MPGFIRFLHGIDVTLNPRHPRYQKIIAESESIWGQLQDTYGIEGRYDRFRKMIDGESAWIVEYAWPLADLLETRIKDLFVIVKWDG